MKNKYKFLGLLGLLPFFATAQLTNNGATIVIEEGATLVVEGAITNMASSTITNAGIIRVEGNLTNDGTLTSTATNAEIIFDGAAAQAFDANGASVRKVTVENTAAPVTLMNTDLTITEELLFDAGSSNLNIGSRNLNLGEDAAVNRTVADGYIQADGTGKVVKNFNTVGSFDFPIGDADEFSPISLSGVPTGEDGTVGVNVEDASLGAELPEIVTDFISRNWTIIPTGFTTSPLAMTTTGTYLPGDVSGDETVIKGTSFDPLVMPEFTYVGAAAGTNQVIGTVSKEVQFTGTNRLSRPGMKVYLAGPLSGTSMSTALNSGGLIPMDSPYDMDGMDDVTVSVSSLNANIVDWVSVELRTGTNGAAIRATYDKFLLNDGTVVDLDGVTPATFRDDFGDVYMAINHRNHLGVMTASDGPADNLIDFTNGTTTAFGTDAMFDNGSNFAMWSGDVSGDGFIQGNDISDLITNFSASGYIFQDATLDGFVQGNDLTTVIANFSKSQQY